MMAILRRLAFLQPLAIFAFAFLVFLRLFAEPAPLHGDMARHLLLALDCLHSDGCVTSLVASSAAGPPHGAAIVQFWTVLLPIGAHLAPVVLAACLALCVSCLFALGRSLGGSLVGWGASVVLLFLWTRVPSLALTPFVWNPNLQPPAAVAFLCFAFAYLRRNSLPTYAAAAVAVGVGLQAHLATALLGLPLLALMAWKGRDPKWLLAVVALGSVYATVAIGSPEILVLASLPQGAPPGGLPQTGFLTATESALFALAALAALVFARNHQGLQSIAQRRFAAWLAATHLPLISLVSAATREPRDAAVFVPGLALLLALPLASAGRDAAPASPLTARIHLATRLAGALAVAAIGLGLLLDAGAPRPMPSGWTNADAKAGAHFLAQRLGWNWADVFRHLRGGRNLATLVVGLAHHVPLDAVEQAPGHVPPSFDVALHKIRGTAKLAPPPGWTDLGRSSGASLVAQAYAPLLDWDHAEVCFLAAGAKASSCRWEPLTLRQRRTDPHPQWNDRTAPLLTRRREAVAVHIRWPARSQAVAFPLTLVADPWRTDSCPPGRFVAATGLQADLGNAADRLVVRGAVAGTPAAVEAEWDVAGGKCLFNTEAFPPAVLQIPGAIQGDVERWIAAIAAGTQPIPPQPPLPLAHAVPAPAPGGLPDETSPEGTTCLGSERLCLPSALGIPIAWLMTLLLFALPLLGYRAVAASSSPRSANGDIPVTPP